MYRLFLFAALVAAPSLAWAQSADPLAGFATNTKDPIQIEADKLTILDKDKKAEFSGRVNVVQGEMTMKAEKLVVFYSASAIGGKPAKAKDAPAAPKGQPQITRIVAEGGVTVKQKDQVATGDRAVYEAVEQTVRLVGNVVLSQGENVVRGESLVVNLVTRKSEIISSGQKSSGGRVMFIGKPGDRKTGEGKPEDKTAGRKN